MVYGDFKDLPRKAVSDKVLLDKAYKIASNPKYDDINTDWHQCSANVLIKNLKRLLLMQEPELFLKTKN